MISFFPYQSTAQSGKPPKGQKFVPPVFGLWRTGDLLVIRNNKLLPITLVNSLESGLTVLPPGVLVSFKPDYDPVAQEPLSVMDIMPPFPSYACRYQSLRYHCETDDAKAVPRQIAISWEFALEITKEEVYEVFAAVGATPKDVCYVIHVNGREWFGNFFVSKDRQTMWTDIFPGEAYTVDANGIKQEVKVTDTLLQVYHRVPDTRRPTPAK